MTLTHRITGQSMDLSTTQSAQSIKNSWLLETTYYERGSLNLGYALIRTTSDFLVCYRRIRSDPFIPEKIRDKAVDLLSNRATSLLRCTSMNCANTAMNSRRGSIREVWRTLKA